jgi:hypothetical protein
MALMPQAVGIIEPVQWVASAGGFSWVRATIRSATPSRIAPLGPEPHKVKQFKLSNDPKFVEKLRDIVGLYVDPPAHAIVLSLDEKSQIQALDRTQPGLPMKKGRAGTMTHDYKRNGTTTLFAALNVLEGKVIGRCMQRHRHQEFIRFLNTIEQCGEAYLAGARPSAAKRRSWTSPSGA